MAKKETTIQVRMTVNEQMRLSALCEEESISMSEGVRRAIKQFVENRERNYRYEFLSILIEVTGQIPDLDQLERFLGWYLQAFESREQIQDFLYMPDTIRESAVKAAWEKLQADAEGTTNMEPPETTAKRETSEKSQ